MATYSDLSDEQIRISALSFAEAIAKSRPAFRQGVQVNAETTTKKLIKDARRIEEYIRGEDL